MLSPSIMYFSSNVKQGQIYTGMEQFILNAEQIGEEKKHEMRMFKSNVMWSSDTSKAFNIRQKESTI